MIRWIFGSVLAATIGSTPVLAQEVDEEQTTAWDTIAFEVKNRGEPIYRWQFTPEYGGFWMEVVDQGAQPSGQHTFAIHTLPADLQRYLVLEDIVGRFPDPAPDSAGCANYLPDAAYGTIRLTRAATTTEISWSSSCRDATYVAFTDLMKEADQLITSWGRRQPVSREETLIQ